MVVMEKFWQWHKSGGNLSIGYGWRDCSQCVVQKVSGGNIISVMAIEQNENVPVSKVQPHKGLPLAHEKSVF